MISVETLQWQSKLTYKSGNEDAFFAAKNAPVWVVADGVTRSKDTNGKYPIPSPAADVANAVVKAMGETLVEMVKKKKMIQPAHISAAFNEASLAARKVNEKLGLWQDNDYMHRDLGGAVATCLVADHERIHYGYIGDCAITCLSAQGKFLWQTTDQVARARRFFPQMDEVGRHEYYRQVRGVNRNNPGAGDASYGVLTGESDALEFVKISRDTIKPGEIILLHSDGLTPFLEHDEFKKLLVKGKKDDIQQYVNKQSSRAKHYDDKTLILLRSL